MLAELIAQGGHNHVLTVGVDIGPTVLRVALLVAVPVVAGFAVLRGFLAEPDRRTLTVVLATAAGAASMELLLSGGLSFSERLVPVLLALLAVPIYLVRSHDPRFAVVVDRARRHAPWLFWPLAALAAWLFAQARFADAGAARTATLLHSGVVLGLVALAWFAVARARVSMQVGAGTLAIVVLAATAQATVLRQPEPTPGVAVHAAGLEPVHSQTQLSHGPTAKWLSHSSTQTAQREWLSG